MTSAPPWLADFQARFGAVIRTPLDRATGTLRATPDAYDPGVGAKDAHNATSGERLAVYNRQYWFRLFTVLQATFPLTTRLLGHWSFNDYAARFLLASPPRSWDIDDAAEGFEGFFAAALDAPRVGPSGLEREALIEAVAIDAAWRAVLRAPDLAAYRPSAEDAARLLDARLTPSPAVAVLEEHWSLVELRQSLLGDAGQAPVSLPARRAQWWALARQPNGVARVRLEPREGELLTLLRRYPVREALGRLEQACSAQERGELPERARRWLARGVELDFWIGISAPEGYDSSADAPSTSRG